VSIKINKMKISKETLIIAIICILVVIACVPFIIFGKSVLTECEIRTKYFCVNSCQKCFWCESKNSCMNVDQLKNCQGEYQIQNDCFIGELMLAIMTPLVFIIGILGFTCCYMTYKNKSRNIVSHIQDTNL